MSERNLLNRRNFVKTSVAATGSAMFIKPETAFTYAANSQLRMGLLGCGGRGTAIAGDFINNNDIQLTAVADFFADKTVAAKERLDKTLSGLGREKIVHRFTGKNSPNEISNCKDVDFIYAATPCYYHPEHVRIITEAGKHVYIEKPAGTDVKGCLEMIKIGKKIEGKLSAHIGFQVRYGAYFQEMTKLLQEGAIGDIACVHGFYFASDLGMKDVPGDSPTAKKLRNWIYDKVLSGDPIVEQNCHVIDAYNWVLKAHPIRATATTARKVRTTKGDVNDHIVVTFIYPNDVRASFMSTQFLPEWGSVEWRFFGPDGYAHATYAKGLNIYGKNPWQAGAAGAGAKDATVDPLGDSTPNKTKAFVNSIITGKYENELASGAESTLSSILARQAAYEGREMTWGELLSSEQNWTTDIDLDKI